MRLAVLSCDRIFSTAESSGGLGKSAHDVATGFARRGHEVTFLGALGSRFDDGRLIVANNPVQMAETAKVLKVDAWFDYGHLKLLSQMIPDAPVLNCVGDRECRYRPPNAVVASEYMQRLYKGARLIRTGVDMAIPFSERHKGYLMFMARFYPTKGWERAQEVCERTGLHGVFAGPGGHGFGLDDYRGALMGPGKWQTVGDALAMLCPYENDASPRVPLETAACGTPTLCLSGDGTQEHVVDGVTGFVCNSVDEMVEAVGKLGIIDRKQVRGWVEENHSLKKMMDEYEAALHALLDGERW